MKFRKVVEVLAVVLILGIIAFSIFKMFEQESIQRYSKTELLLDTVFEVAVFAEDEVEGNRLLRESFNEVRALEKVLSRFVSGSDVDKINNHAGIEPVEVSRDTFKVIKKGMYFGELSDGGFDVTIAPLMELWGFGTGQQRVPSLEEIEKTLPLIDFREIKIDEQRYTVYLPDDQMALDLGGVAKGYIVDRIVQYLQSQNVENAFVNAGGDIRVIGSRIDDTPWRIGIRHPRDRDDQEIIAVIPIVAKAVVTSGDYERFFTSGGERYHHILDPHDGFPASGVISVSIVAQDCITADGLSTAVFILGPQKGLELLESLPQVEGVIIDSQDKLYVSSGLKDIIEIR